MKKTDMMWTWFWSTHFLNNRIEWAGERRISSLTLNWLKVKISMFRSFALLRISFSFSSGTFFVKTIRFNVETCLANLRRTKTFSGLSTKMVFNEAKNKMTWLDRMLEGHVTLIDDMHNSWFTQCIIQRNIDHTMKMTSQSRCHPLVNHRGICGWSWKESFYFNTVDRINANKCILSRIFSELNQRTSDFSAHCFSLMNSIRSYRNILFLCLCLSHLLIRDPCIIRISINTISQTSIIA